MRYETQTVRVGEWLGPVDWVNFDFDAAVACLYRCHTRDGDGLRAAKIAQFKELDDAFRAGIECRATSDGGVPRVGWGEVLRVGMYDGWPFWRPMPTVQIATHMGAETHWFGSITDTQILAAHSKDGEQ